MTAGEIAKWLETKESRAVGFTRRGESESVGRQSGRRIIAILKTRQADLTESDYVHMRKVIGFVKRHTAQRPAGDVSRTRWRYSLMNWGRSPCVKDRRVTVPPVPSVQTCHLANPKSPPRLP